MTDQATASEPEISASDNRLVWVDLEMTGLDPDRHVIVEIACIVTDAQLRLLDDGLDLVVHATEDELAAMDNYVTKMHDSSGLTAEIRRSTISVAAAEQAVCDYISQHCPAGSNPPLAGNSIATDRTFIRRYMPKLDQMLHYRMIDVTTIKELSRRWFPRVYYGQPKKAMSHRALTDIVESIRELAYFQRTVFTAPPGPTTEAVAENTAATIDAFTQTLASLAPPQTSLS
ncbi:oligoribonuclease [Corynebacterium choanae]|uniref:Oligoribonuclease n=1 Tax=Corynebacterium choanae TaxID=1862358 RepID=A0A3G6J7X4_9CORY|nr:oligoribonuclease [Corynebacterium choanae]AZA14157.1 Oligoribonuclease [Corynebacterium choanae]